MISLFPVPVNPFDKRTVERRRRRRRRRRRSEIKSSPVASSITGLPDNSDVTAHLAMQSFFFYCSPLTNFNNFDKRYSKEILNQKFGSKCIHLATLFNTTPLLTSSTYPFHPLDPISPSNAVEGQLIHYHEIEGNRWTFINAKLSNLEMEGQPTPLVSAKIRISCSI
jgi:hypothetical protein